MLDRTVLLLGLNFITWMCQLRLITSHPFSFLLHTLIDYLFSAYNWSITFKKEQREQIFITVMMRHASSCSRAIPVCLSSRSSCRAVTQSLLPLLLPAPVFFFLPYFLYLLSLPPFLCLWHSQNHNSQSAN